MINELESLNGLIVQWAKARKLDTADPARQFLKVIEEFYEIFDPNNTSELTIDAIGDYHITLIILALQTGCDIEYPEHYIEGFSNVNGRIAAAIARGKPVGLLIGEAILANEGMATDINVGYGCCIAQAYNEIKDRKGEMRNGVFVKEEDL